MRTVAEELIVILAAMYARKLVRWAFMKSGMMIDIAQIEAELKWIAENK